MSRVTLYLAAILVMLCQISGLLAAPVPLSYAERDVDGMDAEVARRDSSEVGARSEHDAWLQERQTTDEVASDTMKCNGHPELCNRKYGNVTFLGSHDSFADSPHWFALSRTQEVNLETQMRMGARMLQAQGRMTNGQLHFCHTSCILFDGGSVESYLLRVKKFMDANPHEVFTFVFTNPEEHSVEKIWKPIFEKTGMDKLAYIPPTPVMTRDDWPTLRELIDTGKRVIVFLDKGADERKEPEKEYILPQFKMMWEDPHNPTDAAFPCTVHRGTEGPLLPTQKLNLINHNLNIDLLPIGKGFRLPDRLNSPRTNGYKSIMHHALGCAADVMEDRNPNFVMLDFMDIGHGMEAVDVLNGFKPRNKADVMRTAKAG